jgi:hypothetical protein
MSEDQFRELFSRPEQTVEPPLPDGFVGTSLNRARRRARTHRRARLATTGIAVVAAAAVTAGVVAAGGPAARTTQQHQAVAAPGSAQVLLGRVSLAADDQTVTARDDQFIYSDTLASHTSYTMVGGKLVGQREPLAHQQLWLSVDGSRTGESIGSGKTRKFAPDTTASIRSPNYHFMETLPTDPDQLLAALKVAIAPDLKYAKAKHATADDVLWAALTGLAMQPVLPPKLAAAIYQAAAKVPGITLVKDTTDAAGRHGIGVSHHVPDVDPVTQTWIFDPKTYQYLGERDVNTKDGSAHGLTAILGRGVVDQVGQLPK